MKQAEQVEQRARSTEGFGAPPSTEKQQNVNTRKSMNTVNTVDSEIEKLQQLQSEAALYYSHTALQLKELETRERDLASTLGMLGRLIHEAVQRRDKAKGKQMSLPGMADSAQ